MLSVYEVYKGLKKMGLPARKTRRLMEFMRKTSLIMSVNYDACLEAVEITLEKKLHTVDSLIYAAALEAGASLLTLDNDFRNLKNAIVLAAPK